MQESLTGIGQSLLPVYERMHAMELRQSVADANGLNHREWMRRLETEQRAHGKAIEEIKSRMTSAILWLALGAGGLALKLIGPKIGL
jgi:hypothetical protein